MYKALVNNSLPFEMNPPKEGWDALEVRDGIFHIVKNNKSYNATVIDANYAEKSFSIKVNGNVYQVQVQDQFDQLIQKLGLEKMNTVKINHIKAPMPGLVLNIMVEPGQAVAKGESVIILEAMKMENVIKAPADAVVKSIAVTKGTAVEKGQILVEFEQ